MKPEKLDYVRYRQACAQETLEVAQMALESGHLRDAVNRLYYACFYSVSALLLCQDMVSAKHTGIRSLFFKNWIKTKRFSREIGRFYQLLFDNRLQGDYQDFVTFRPDEVRQWFDQAQSFTAEIAAEVEKQLGRQPGEP